MMNNPTIIYPSKPIHIVFMREDDQTREHLNEFADVNFTYRI